MIIDVFTQMGPGVANHAARPVPPLEDTSTVEGLLAVLDRAGIDRAVTFAPRWVGGAHHDPDYEIANRAVADAVAQHPDRLTGLARVNPHFGDRASRMLESCLEQEGFRGLLLDPEWDNFDPGDRALVDPLVQTVRAASGVLVLESGYSPAQPALAWPLAERFPDVPIVLAHMGGRLTADAIVVARHCPNVYLETSDHMYYIGQYAEQVGVDRVLFGSNAPFATVEAELYKVTTRDDLSDEHKGMILGGNAASLLAL